MIDDVKKILKISALFLLFLFIVLFAFSRSKDLVFGMKIKNVNIENGATVVESELEVAGNAKNAVSVYLNDREISIDQAGNFKETIALIPGYNLVHLSASDKFGKKDEKNYELIFAQKQPEGSGDAPLDTPESE